MEFVFLNTAHMEYPDEADFGRIFGIVTTLLFALAFLLQLVSGRLMAWLGASSMLTAISAVYVLSFALAWALIGSPIVMLAVSGGYMLTYLLIYYSAEPSYQLFYKMLPLQQRDGFRYVAQGIATFLGILLGAGLQFLHTGLGWGFPALTAIGTVGAAGLLALSWLVRQLYMKELVRSVQTLGLAADKELAESYKEFYRNARTMNAVQAMLRHESDEAREIAVNILGHSKDKRYLSGLLAMIDDDSTKVKIAALKAINLSTADLPAMVKVASLLEDSEPDVRKEVVHKLAQMKHLSSQAFFFLRMKLLDRSPMVVAEAVKAMYLLESAQSYEACYEVIERILKEGGEPAIHVCRVIGELKLERFATEVERLLMDPHPAVRVAATGCLGVLKRFRVVPLLIERLPTADQELYRVTIQALIDMGDRVIDTLKSGLRESTPKIWRASVTALAQLLPDENVRGWLAEQGTLKLADIATTALLPEAFRKLDRPDLAELAQMRQLDLERTIYEGVWSILERLTDEQVVLALRRTLDDVDEETRSGGLEVLAEGVGERKLSQRLAAALQADTARLAGLTAESAHEAVSKAAETTDDWWQEMAAELQRGERRPDMQEEQGLLGRLNKVVFLKKFRSSPTYRWRSWV